jgi:hypothetical protein
MSCSQQLGIAVLGRRMRGPGGRSRVEGREDAASVNGHMIGHNKLTLSTQYPPGFNISMTVVHRDLHALRLFADRGRTRPVVDTCDAKRQG